MATQGVNISIFGGDGIADAGFISSFTDNSSVDGVTATKPGSASASDVKTAFEAAYTAANGNVSLLGIYTHESYDAVMILGAAAMMSGDLAANIDTVGTNYSGATGVITFDANGDVAGNGYLVCGFTYDSTAGAVSFDCTSTWTTEDGLAATD